MKLTVICVGRALPGQLQDVVNDYEQRLKPFAEFDWRLVKPATLANAQQSLQAESGKILALLQPSDNVILLDERGTQQTNTGFARTFETLLAQQGRLVLIIGGAYGVSDEVRQRADFVWSLSKLVLPHELVRVILSEQIYRTFMVLQSHPYHHS